jgi:hypothetical protein
MAKKTNESRAYTRSPVRSRMEVRLPCGILLEGSARDISIKGVLFDTERSLPIGSKVKVNLVLDSGQEEFRLDLEGVVARITEHGVAIEFTEIDVGSVEHLRNLVLYNSPDTTQTDKELAATIGLKRKG